MGDQHWAAALKPGFGCCALLLFGPLGMVQPRVPEPPFIHTIAHPIAQAPVAPDSATSAPNQPAPSRLEAWFEENKILATGSATAAALALAYGVVLVVKPRWLLLLPGKFKIPNTSWEVPLGLLLWLKYHPRVLDAWVANHLPEITDRFKALQTVKDRKIHIPIQIKLDDDPLDPLRASHLQPVFSHSPATLLIVGEGGVGKTSFACQIARWGLGMPEEGDSKPQTLCQHKMLPVLIEQELNDTPLPTAIREQLPRNADGTFIADELLDALLRQRRVLVILDHVSEMSEATYSQMQKALEARPINALVVTSRLAEKNLGRPHHHRLEPQKIEGDKLYTFIPPYLARKGKKDLFADNDEFLRTCRRLSKMMAATLQDATALLVTLYIDQVIFVDQHQNIQLPDDIPELMLEYLCRLNREESIDHSMRRDNDDVKQAAKRVAWECLKDTYRPSDARYPEVLAALADGEAADEAKAWLNYLKKPLGLIQISPAETTVKIILDPVAEYLAALHLTEHCQQEDPENRWQQFFETIDADLENLPAMRGFLLAVRNCCEKERKHLPAGVLAGLNERAEFDPEAQKAALRRQRINRYIDMLEDDEASILIQTIQNLGNEGYAAQKAVPDLLKLLRSPDQSVEVRIEALNALMAIQPDQAVTRHILQDVLANRSETDAPEVRAAAIKGLLQIKADADGLVPRLQSYFNDPSEVGLVRVQAGEGLRQLGELQKLLVVQVLDKYNQDIQLVNPPKTQTISLSEDVALTLVYIPGGRFLMGSPEGEGYSFEKPQHEVTIEPFWLGQFPVTQTQHEAGVGRNPAAFRIGGSHPVETVSWRDAVTYCQKLTELTKLEFRLPSEAEWEYACRAGTTTSFHTGPTITTDLANYRGTDWDYGGQIYSGAYGPGPHGIFRQQTTPVGQFPPNAFGLYDMHGNVWEWCADHYHESYEGASTNNAPWLSSDEGSLRLLRGGVWNYPPDLCRSAYRNRSSPDGRNGKFGFRVVGSVARAL
jgi:formylglycine-generating enzyme required for sulfatase activity/cation transport regulator ChaB